MDRTKLEKYSEEVITELTGNILPFWMKNVIDYDSGGFNGSVAGDGTINPSADKSAVMAARILWTFSRAFIKLNDAQYLRKADLMFKYIVSHFLDKEHGGVFWTLDGSGKPLVATKKMYAQGFTMYAFAEYAKASGSSRALDEAKNLFSLVEKYGRDMENGGYIDALSADWSLISDMRLSAKEMNTPKSMNTNLHVMEALSVLVMYFKDKQALEALENIVNVFAVTSMQFDKLIALSKVEGQFNA
jgi:cellobiose epimerase